nr:hypothetical protein [Kibdelosporangium sp. MJ126-NF4]
MQKIHPVELITPEPVTAGEKQRPKIHSQDHQTTRPCVSTIPAR